MDVHAGLVLVMVKVLCCGFLIGCSRV